MPYEVIKEMKSLLNFMENKEVHERELESIPTQKQKEIYDFLTSELDLILSHQLMLNQVRNDPNTALGSLLKNKDKG